MHESITILKVLLDHLLYKVKSVKTHLNVFNLGRKLRHFCSQNSDEITLVLNLKISKVKSIKGQRLVLGTICENNIPFQEIDLTLSLKSVPTILRSQVWIPSTRSMLIRFTVKFCPIFVIVLRKEQYKPKRGPVWPIFTGLYGTLFCE